MLGSIFSCRALIYTLIGSEALAGVGLVDLVAGSVLAHAGGGSGSSCSPLMGLSALSSLQNVLIGIHRESFAFWIFLYFRIAGGEEKLFAPRTSFIICSGGLFFACLPIEGLLASFARVQRL